MNYLVPAGLYAIGEPTPEDPVVVTANYKMSYDIVRRSLAGRNVWLLILETFGVNVWCAAGKGTFGTGELIARIEATNLKSFAGRATLILPILGAPGVAAHEVKKRTGFEVRYAAIRANDLPEYLDNGMLTTPGMRELTFAFRERLALVPVELVTALKPLGIAGGLLFLVVAFFLGPAAALRALVAFIGAALSGIVVGPLLLGLLPGRSFSFKGALVGIVWTAACLLAIGIQGMNYAAIGGAFLALPAVSAFYTLNFTGCTTFTSPSGVRKEMRFALPAMGFALITGGLLVLAGLLL
jgi:acetyl-CoA decarbonylase/synthase complex subunit gamma